MAEILNILIEQEAYLQEKIQTNYGKDACRVHPIHEEDMEITNGLTRNAIAKIVIRKMEVSSRRGAYHTNYQEKIDRIYIWKNFQTTKLPWEYEEIIKVWLTRCQILLNSAPGVEGGH
jgi:hypothetical protein